MVGIWQPSFLHIFAGLPFLHLFLPCVSVIGPRHFGFVRGLRIYVISRRGGGQVRQAGRLLAHHSHSDSVPFCLLSHSSVAQRVRAHPAPSSSPLMARRKRKTLHLAGLFRIFYVYGHTWFKSEPAGPMQCSLFCCQALMFN